MRYSVGFESSPHPSLGGNIEHEHLVFHFTIFSILIVMAVQKLYPRGTVKRIVKAHSNRSVSKNADILVRGRPYMTPLYYPVANTIFKDLLGLHTIHARVRLHLSFWLGPPVATLRFAFST